MKVHTFLTARKQRNRGETNNGISLTMPDQAISPAELLRRYATGQPLGFKNVSPVYDDENGDIPELYKMNKMDRLHAQQESFHNLSELKDTYTSYLNEQKKQQAAKIAAEKAAKQEKATTTEQKQERSDAKTL